ncbi:MAG: hypothetical protein IJW25_00020, partial [Clostridia bacterium]|nr:hypothetical protein [Clostridia bacterium]
PTSTTISYGASGSQTISVTTDLKKTGYTYSEWKAVVNGSETTFAVTSGNISIPKNIVSAGNAITISPNWQLETYTATFITNGEYITDNGYTYNSTLKGYTVNYTIEDEFTFPSAVKADNIFSGWEVTSAESESRWRSGDVYIVGDMISGNYGDVTFTALLSYLVFEETAITKTYGDSNFVNPLGNGTSVQPTFTSTATSVATVDNSGLVQIKGKGTTTITASVTIGGVVSSASYTLTVNARNITSAVVYPVISQEYNGKAITPIPQIVDVNNLLTNGTDYTLAYQSNTNVGTATITISGKGNYTGSTTVSFEITARDIASASISSLTNSTYTGSEITKTITVTDSVPNTSTTLVNGTDYTVTYLSNVNIGTAVVVINGKGNYKGTNRATFEITNATITGTVTQNGTLTYTGGQQTPSITNSLVSKGSQPIAVTYSTSSNGTYSSTLPTYLNVGTYTLYYKATASNHNTLSGSLSIIVNARDISNAEITDLADKVYTGSAITQDYDVIDEIPMLNTILISGTDYTGVFSNNTLVGTATLTVTGKGNFTGTKTATFNITNASITGTITQSGSLTYNGSAQRPTLTYNITTVGNQSPSYTYSQTENGSYGSTIPTYTNYGTYTLYVKVTASNHNSEIIAVTITVNKLEIEKP